VGAITGDVPHASAAARRRTPYLPYTPNSYFRSDVASLAVDGEATSRFLDFMATFPEQQEFAYPRLTGMDGNLWGMPWARGTAKDPIWRIRSIGEENEHNVRLQKKGFHAPPWLADVLTGTNDSPLCVMDTESGKTVFVTNAAAAGDYLLDVGSAGVTYHATNGLDHRHPRSNGARNFTSRGRISDAMVIRRGLVEHGIKSNTDLGHVLHMFFVETSSADGFRSPMVGEESGKHGFGAEGTRIAIRSDVNLAKRGLSPAALVIARTLQVRGCYHGDNSGSASILKAEQENPKHPVWKGRLRQDSLKRLRWDDFVVLTRP